MTSWRFPTALRESAEYALVLAFVGVVGTAATVQGSPFTSVFSSSVFSSGVFTSAAATFCPGGEVPTFSGGFAQLKALLGDTMGEPRVCPYPMDYTPEGGDLRQDTTTGTAVYVASRNRPTFTRNFEHWALTEEGLVFWSDQDQIEPPPRRPSGTLLFRASWPADAAERTTRIAGWLTAGGVLFSRGEIPQPVPLRLASPHGRAFAIEAQMRGDPDRGAFGLYTERGQAWYRLGHGDGKLVLTAEPHSRRLAPSATLQAHAVASADFQPRSDWHTYRLEVQRTHFRVLVDNVPLLDVEDDRFPGDVGNGVWTDGAAVEVRDYRLLEL